MRIVFVDIAPIIRRDGKIYLPERSYLGYREYKKYLSHHFPQFSMTLLALDGVREFSGQEDLEILHACDAADINFEPEKARPYLEKLDQRALVHVLLREQTADFIHLGHTVVYLIEATPIIRWKMFTAQAEDSLSSLAKARVRLGLLRQEIKNIGALRRAASAQFNGPAAARRYSRFTRSPLTFLDHRVNSVNSPLPKPASGSKKLSVGFSGRIETFKGSRYLPKISHELYNLDPDIKFFIMGDGSDRERVLRESAPNIIYQGFMRYREEWEPFVRQAIDIMIFPHPQGDPSMTYYEALGQGVPILAFSNETSDMLAQEDLGWTVQEGNIRELAHTVFSLTKNPHDVSRKSQNALQFMSAHLYPQTVARRIDHLVSVAEDTTTSDTPYPATHPREGKLEAEYPPTTSHRGTP